MTKEPSPQIVAALRRAQRSGDVVILELKGRSYEGEVVEVGDRKVLVDTWVVDPDGREYEIRLSEVLAVTEGGEEEAC